MTSIAPRPWKVKDELIEQPSWGGRYIIDMKGLSADPAWAGKKVGQSYEFAKTSQLIDPESGQARSFAEMVETDARGLLGPEVIAKFGTQVSLLIKLTQAKGNSFQVHLPSEKVLGHWEPKPEAWFYLAPGLFTFGVNMESSYEEYGRVLHEIDDEMKRLSAQVKSGAISVTQARDGAQTFIRSRDPYRFVNVVNAAKDDIVNLTAGAIHHSWEEDDAQYPEGNLVYEVQVNVPDDRCSMRGFDKGKFLDDGGLRPTHVADYLATISQDNFHNELANHIRKPQVVAEAFGAKTESLFRTPYFLLDRITLSPGATLPQSTEIAFHHLFVLDGEAVIGGDVLQRGQSYFVPSSVGIYDIASETGALLLKTYLPVDAHRISMEHLSAADRAPTPAGAH